MEENLVKEYLNKLDIRKSLVPDRMHPQVLREIDNVTASPLSTIFARSEQSGEDTDDTLEESKPLLSLRTGRRIQGT